jgi:hypothetical protein
MAFEIVAERNSEIVRMTRNSSLIAIAKARVWASEGWDVTIVVGDDETFDFPSLASGIDAPLQPPGLRDRGSALPAVFPAAGAALFELP